MLTFLYLPSFVHPISTLMVKDLATFSGYDRRWVSIDDVSPVLANSVIMSEDGQFCFHRGVDLGELRGVVDDALAGEATRGASTITMQTVKNLFLWSRPLGSVRKVVELPLAVYFDAVMSKRRIMEIYLNIAEWGPGIYGIEAAAQHHFGVSAKQLSRRQAALLAVSLPNPIARNPAKPGPGLRRLASLIERARRALRRLCGVPRLGDRCRLQKNSPQRWPKRRRACIGTRLSQIMALTRPFHEGYRGILTM